jgi:hypothetical protein
LGAGDFRLAALLVRLEAMGVACPVGPEIYDEDGDHHDPGRTARRLADQMDRLADATGCKLGRAAPHTPESSRHVGEPKGR